MLFNVTNEFPGLDGMIAHSYQPPSRGRRSIFPSYARDPLAPDMTGDLHRDALKFLEAEKNARLTDDDLREIPINDPVDPDAPDSLDAQSIQKDQLVYTIIRNDPQLMTDPQVIDLLDDISGAKGDKSVPAPLVFYVMKVGQRFKGFLYPFKRSKNLIYGQLFIDLSLQWFYRIMAHSRDL